jgi:hypothetical protein
MPNVKKMIRRAKPGLKQIAGEDSDEYKFLSNMATVVFDDLAMLYSEGEVHRAVGQSMWNYSDFVAEHNELAYHDDADNLPIELHMELTRLLYKAYTDGFKGIRR